MCKEVKILNSARIANRKALRYIQFAPAVAWNHIRQRSPQNRIARAGSMGFITHNENVVGTPRKRSDHTVGGCTIRPGMNEKSSPAMIRSAANTPAYPDRSQRAQNAYAAVVVMTTNSVGMKRAVRSSTDNRARFASIAATKSIP